MLVTEVYLWGAVLVACLLGVSIIALAIADSRMLKRILTIFVVTVLQMAVVLAVVWFCYQTHSVWSYLLWYVLILFLSTCWCLYPLQSMWKKMVTPIGISMLVGSIVVAGSTLLMLSANVFVTVYSVLMACLTASMIQTMLNFQRSLHQPMAQRQELSWRESVLPQVRLMAQPLVMVIPTLYAGMLLGGIPAFTGLIITLLLISASFIANVLTGVIALSIIRKGTGH